MVFATCACAHIYIAPQDANDSHKQNAQDSKIIVDIDVDCYRMGSIETKHTKEQEMKQIIALAVVKRLCRQPGTIGFSSMTGKNCVEKGYSYKDFIE